MSVGSVSSESSVAGGAEPVPVWGDIRDGRRYEEEVYRRGEPGMRPYVARVVLGRTAGMAAQEMQFRGRALYATIMGQGVRVTPEALRAAIVLHYGVMQCAVRVEVCSPPFNFFVRFNSEEDCTQVVLASGELRFGTSWIRFERWDPTSRGTAGKFEYKTALSIEGLPEEAWEPQVVKLLLAALDGELIQMLPATDRWVLPITAWLRDPGAVPKMLMLTVPVAGMLPINHGFNEDVQSKPLPDSLRKIHTRDYPLIIHVNEVIDRGELLTEDVDPEYFPYIGEDLSRRHTFKTWRGKIDGTGPGNHGFA